MTLPFSANTSYLNLLFVTMQAELRSSPRGQGTRETLNHQTCVDMTHPVVTNTGRALNYKFMVAEALWMLQGSDKLADLTQFCKRMADFSDDGVILNGAYGPKYWHQLAFVVNKLKEDPDTRQAVMSFWRPNPEPSKDIPCTCTLQFLIRGDFIHLNVFMRSQDVWLGWPYDVFSFTMLCCYVALHMRQPLSLGTLTITAGSQHLYDRDADKVTAALRSNGRRYEPMCLYGLNTPDVLLEYLKYALYDKFVTNPHPFFTSLRELCH